MSISSGVSSAVGAIIADLSGASAARGNDVEVANYPNPFQGVNGPSGFDRSTSVGLELVDGGENGENVPMAPLLVKARGLDVIVAADASADTSEDECVYSSSPLEIRLLSARDRAASRTEPTGPTVAPLPLNRRDPG